MEDGCRVTATAARQQQQQGWQAERNRHIVKKLPAFPEKQRDVAGFLLTQKKFIL